MNCKVRTGVSAAWVVALAAGLAFGQGAQTAPAGGAPAPAASTVEGELVGPRMARFFFPGSSAADLLPSYALLAPLARTGDLPAGFALKPQMTKTVEGKWRARLAIDAGTSLYGTGEIGGSLLRNGRTSITWNTDAYGYTPTTSSLYQSHPWVLAVRADGTAFGVLADTTYRTEIDLDGHIQFTAEGKPFQLVVIDRDSPEEVMKALAGLTGTMPLPPKWALGYHQCRYSYFPESRVREIAKGFRDRDIPCTVIWFDIDYMAGFRVFAFNPIHFPDVAKLNSDLGAMGFKRIWMINPGIKSEDSPSANDPSPAELKAAGAEAKWNTEVERFKRIRGEGLDKGYFVKTAAGELYRGAVWPGLCFFPDYTNPTVRAWFAAQYKEFMARGIDGVWNDMNEPAIFNVATKTMPEDNKHTGGKWSAWPHGTHEWDVPAGDHARFHNVYGMLMAQSTYEGIAAANPTKRPFVLTRAGFLGSHRYAATWTGDNSATWNDLEQSIPMVLNLGLSGQPFSGPDIGGFIGNGPCGQDDVACKGRFFARWMGIGAMLPFARGHTGKGNDDKEPWAYDQATENTCRQALQRRYRLLPYFYTLFREAAETGMPVARPLFFADPKDPSLRSEDDAFLVGGDIMVVGQLMPGRDRVVTLPKGIWRPVELVAGAEKNIDLPALYIRGGAVVPAGEVKEYVGEPGKGTLTLYVSLDAAGKASGVLYEDAGDGFEYKTQEQFLLTTYSAQREGEAVTVRVASTSGKMARPDRAVEVVVVTDGGKTFSARGKDGQPVTVSLK